LPQEAAAALLELVELVLAAPGLPAGLSIAAERLLAPRGFGGAVALAEHGGALHASPDAGTYPSPAIPLSDAAHPLVAAYRSPESAVLVLEDVAPFHLQRPVLFPVRAPDGRPFAALLASAPAGADLDGAADALKRTSPPLFALWERDALWERLAERERRLETLHAICDALPDPVLITDARHAIVLDNRRARELFVAGAEASDERKRFVEVNHHLFSSFLARPPGAGTAREVSLVEPASGADLRLDVVAAPLPAEMGNEGSTVWLMRDVTQLKRASNELQLQFRKVRRAEARSRRERDRLDLILSSVGAPIVVTDDRSEVVLMNREAERLFEAPEDAPTGAAEERGAAANEARFARVVGDFARGADAVGVSTLDLTDPAKGDDFPVEIVSGKILDEKGALAAVVSVVRDKSGEVENARLATELGRLNEVLEERVREAVAELSQRNRELEWQRRELERAYRLKSEFLASMSHELRTPINALLGYTALMRDRIYGDLNARQEEALARMQTASGHLLELVNDILDLAKIEAGKMPVHVEEVDLADLLREVSQAVEPLVSQKRLGYAADVPASLPVLRTDRTRVKQIVLNLLSNAVKFTHTGEVRVSARVVEAGVEVAVADTGIGIAPADLETIWDDFRQVDQSSTREYGGTGLGLSIVRKLLGLLGGSVRVESQAGKGSVFTVTLPLESKPLPAGEESARAANEGGARAVTRRPPSAPDDEAGTA
jgi:signal transduction histidine kinase